MSILFINLLQLCFISILFFKKISPPSLPFMYRIVYPYFHTVMLKRVEKDISSPKVFHPVVSPIHYYCVNYFLTVLSGRELLILHSSRDGEPTLHVSRRLFTCAKKKKVETSAFVSLLVTFAMVTVERRTQ